MTAQTILPANTLSSGYDVANSCRFDTNASMTKTSSTGSNTISTFSAWVKRSKLGAEQKIFNFTGGSNNFNIEFKSTDILAVSSYDGSSQMNLRPTRVFRDVSAWYHIVVAIDTTQGTAANRVKIYVNGVQESSFGTETYPAEDETIEMNGRNSTNPFVGQDGGDDKFFNGYLAELVWIDGSQLAQTSFGEFDEDSGIWKPINVSGLTFGTNGFYLDFEASGNLGNDANGGTDLGETNIAATDQSIDTCTNNFVTGNPIAAQGGSAQSDSLLTFTEGNLLMAANSETGIATIGVSAGKWYWEVKVIADQDGLIIGACNEHFNINAELGYNSPSSPSAAKIFGYYGGNGNSMIVVGDGTSQSYGSAISVNDIIGVALDVDSADQTCTFYLNGSSQGSLDITNLGSGQNYFPAVGNWSTSTIDISFNFGSPPYAISSGNADANDHGNFEYEVPSGYFALNTKNLAEYG
jgi:hypothetical protein